MMKQNKKKQANQVCWNCSECREGGLGYRKKEIKIQIKPVEIIL